MAPAIFADFAQFSRYQTGWSIAPLVAAQPRQQVAWATRGEYWSVNSQRVVRTRKKIYEYKTWKLASEIDIHREPDGPSIFSNILEYLDRCKKELKGRYLDITHLKTLGPYVNWKSLYEESKNV